MKRDLLGLSLVVGAILIFGHTILWEGASPFGGDISLQFYPWKCYTRAMLSIGEIPYWNPYTYGGAPFLANIQSAVFYPLDLFLFLFPMEWFFGLSLLLHLLLAGVGAYLLARICGATAFPAVIAGIAYGLNGFTMIHIPAGNHLTYAGAAWVPWMLWATAGFVLTSRSRLPWALGGTLISCLHFLCGHPQMMFYSLVFSFFWCLGLGLWVERDKEHSNYLAPILRTAMWSTFLMLGIFMAGMQLIPTIQYFLEANRATGLNLEMATEFSFAPHRLITLFCPEFYGTMIRGTHYDSFVYWSCAYAGAMIPVLALIAIFRGSKHNRVVYPLAGIAFLGLLLAWGRGNPFYALIYHLPGFGHFRAPAKYLPYYLVPVCVLASLGVECLGNRAFEKFHRAQRSTGLYLRRASMALVLCVGLSILIYYGIPLLSGLSNDTLGHTPGDRIISLERTASIYRAVLSLVAGLVAYGIARLTPKAPRFVLSIALGMVLFFDLFYFGQNYLNVSLVRMDTIRASTIPPAEIHSLYSPRFAPHPDRVMNRHDLDIPNVLMHWHLYNIAGYDPMSLRAYNRQIGLLENWKEGDYHDNIQLTQTDHPVLDLLNVRYILTREELTDPQLTLRSSNDHLRIYERISNRRAWATIRPLEGESDWIPADDDIQFQTYDPHEIVFRLSNPKPVRMRVAEWFYPGWQAEAIFADGLQEPLLIEPSEEGLREFRIPANTQTIRMTYRAPWLGWILTGFFGLLFLMLVGYAILARTDRFLLFMQWAMGRDF